MKCIVATNLLVLAIVFVGGLCQDLEQDSDSNKDSKSYYDDTTSEVVKVLKRIIVLLYINMQLQIC